MFIKLTLRIIKTGGFHNSDPSSNSKTFVNVDKIDYYYKDSFDRYKSVICINAKEFRCMESVDEIADRIMLAEITDNLA